MASIVRLYFAVFATQAAMVSIVFDRRDIGAGLLVVGAVVLLVEIRSLRAGEAADRQLTPE